MSSPSPPQTLDPHGLHTTKEGARQTKSPRCYPIPQTIMTSHLSRALTPASGLFMLTTVCVLYQVFSLCRMDPVLHKRLQTSPPSFRHIFPPGALHPLLYHQNLSHAALHSVPFALYLTSLFSPRTVAIAGVEFGADMRNFARAGYRVHAIEPGERFVTALRKTISQYPQWDVKLHPYAATSESNGTLVIEYRNKVVAKSVPTRRLDDLIHEHLALLSADVQGGELDILQGTSGLMPTKVDSILVEISACGPRVKSLLQLLDKDYVMFDFVPWGRHQRQKNGSLNLLDSYALDQKRPGEISEYNDWFCKKRQEFYWLQTDVFAVRRELLTGIWKELERIGDVQCYRKNVECILRKLLSSP